mmetsp:Transcript_18645/g.58647  ORF Transcript_18645/g.58647 Transcript_18645/m.58647 type:complete len:206 (-) Transcript_18645:400-1017(-)
MPHSRGRSPRSTRPRSSACIPTPTSPVECTKSTLFFTQSSRRSPRTLAAAAAARRARRLSRISAGRRSRRCRPITRPGMTTSSPCWTPPCRSTSSSRKRFSDSSSSSTRSAQNCKLFSRPFAARSSSRANFSRRSTTCTTPESRTPGSTRRAATRSPGLRPLPDSGSRGSPLATSSSAPGRTTSSPARLDPEATGSPGSSTPPAF